MAGILLLLDDLQKKSMVRDYVKLSGYLVVERELFSFDEYKEQLLVVELVLMEGNRMDEMVEVCERIREATRKPILVLSEDGGEWNKIKLFQAGADDYIVTPCLQSELMARIKAHIRQYKRLIRPFGLVEVRGLIINAMNRQVTLNGEEILMRLKEFDILLYLAQHPDVIVTKQQLYQKVWQDEVGGDEYYNTVAVHVKRIREKLGEDENHPEYIETVWGIGYRFLS